MRKNIEKTKQFFIFFYRKKLKNDDDNWYTCYILNFKWQKKINFSKSIFFLEKYRKDFCKKSIRERNLIFLKVNREKKGKFFGSVYSYHLQRQI